MFSKRLMLAVIGGLTSVEAATEYFNGPFSGQFYGKYSKPSTLKSKDNCRIKKIQSCNNSKVTGNDVWCWMKMDFENCTALTFEGAKCKGKANVDACVEEGVSGDILELTMFSDGWKGKNTELVPAGFQIKASNSGLSSVFGAKGKTPGPALTWKGKARLVGLTYDTSGEADFIQFHMAKGDNLFKKKEPVVKVDTKPVKVVVKTEPIKKEPVKVVVKTEPIKKEPVKVDVKTTSKPVKVDVGKALDSVTAKVEGMEKKSHKVATMLALSYTGMLGIDRFYLGYIIWGAIKAVTLGGLGIWALIDSIFVSHCWLKDANGEVLIGCTEAEVMTPLDVVKGAVKDAGDAVGSDKAADFW